MRRTETTRWIAPLAAITLCIAVLGLAVTVAPALAQDDEEDERHVIRKVIVRCDGEGCDESAEVDFESLPGDHKFAWVTGHGPGQIAIRSHIGGGYLGVLLAELTPELRGHFGVDESAGVMISKVIDDSPAARAGLRVGDIVSAVDGKAVKSGLGLGHAIRQKEDGETVLLEVWRNGSVMNLTAAVEERKPADHSMNWSFVLDCDDDEEDCSLAKRHVRLMHGDKLDACEGGQNCDVRVRCEGEDKSDCECTVNGEATDCRSLPGFKN